MQLNNDHDKDVNPFHLSDADWERLTKKSVEKLIEQSKEVLKDTKPNDKNVKIEKTEVNSFEDIIPNFKGRYTAEQLKDFFTCISSVCKGVEDVLSEYIVENKIGIDLYTAFIPNLTIKIFMNTFLKLTKVMSKEKMKAFVQIQCAMINQSFQNYYNENE